MDARILTARAVLAQWHQATEQQLSLTEFLVLNALLVACYESFNEGMIKTVSIADVTATAKLSRETVRRAMLSLERQGCVRQVNQRWLPAFDGR